MAISNPISQASIMAEFGGGYPFVLGNYRRGAGIVPVHSGTAGIPTGYPISFQDFLGKSAVGVVLSNTSQSQNTVAPNNAFARLEFTSSIVQGRVTNLSGAVNTKFTWNIGGSAASYEIRAVYASGTSPAGSALNTWHASNSNTGWHLQQSTNGSSSGTFTVEIRPAGGGATLATATFSLNVTRDP